MITRGEPRGTPPGEVAISGGSPLHGELAVPGDKSISHRAIMVASLAEGTSVIAGLCPGADVEATRMLAQALGAAMTTGSAGDELRVSGGAGRLTEPTSTVHAGNSGTTMRLGAGLVAGFPFQVRFDGDESLSKRPMDRIALPLKLMGATVEGRGPSCLPPITVRGPGTGGSLQGIDYSPPVASAQVKSAILLAGLNADGVTRVSESLVSRRHTEEILSLAGADIEVHEPLRAQDPTVVEVRRSTLSAFEMRVPGDPSQAAFWIVGALLVPGSSVRVKGIYDGPARTGFLQVLERMGADLDITVSYPPAEPSPAASGGAEPAIRSRTIDVMARHSELEGTVVHGAEIPGLDEIPILAVAAAAAKGTTVFHEVGELRVKESDRLAATSRLVTSLGATAEVRGNDLVVRGTAVIRPATTDAGGDHRMAMSAAIAALAAPGARSLVRGFDSVVTSYPSFVEDLVELAGPDALG